MIYVKSPLENYGLPGTRFTGRQIFDKKKQSSIFNKMANRSGGGTRGSGVLDGIKASSFHFVEELFRSQTGTVWKAKYRSRGAAGGRRGGGGATNSSSTGSTSRSKGHLTLLANAPFVVLKERRAAELGRAKSITRELDLLRQLNHPNVIQCLGYFYDNARGIRSSNEKGVLFMVLEYADGGDLYKEIVARKARHEMYQEKEILNIFNQLCRGLSHIHEKGNFFKMVVGLCETITRKYVLLVVDTFKSILHYSTCSWTLSFFFFLLSFFFCTKHNV